MDTKYSTILLCLSSAASTASAQCAGEPETRTLDDLTVTVTGAEVDLRLDNLRRGHSQSGVLGLDLPPSLQPPTDCGGGGAEICWAWGEAASLRIAKDAEDVCYEVSWTSTGLSSLNDCFEIGSSSERFWYGGGESHTQRFPLSPDEIRDSVPFVPYDSFGFPSYYGGVVEPWWFNSDGVGIWVPTGVPLFHSWNSDGDGRMCLAAKNRDPYATNDPEILNLNYNLCVQDNAKEIQLYGAANLLGLPQGIPDERMMTDPIWSTWAKYKTGIDQDQTLQFAADIRAYGFNDSQLEIDDNWETCYGEAVFGDKFPDPAGMVSQLKADGFRVTLWIHPFINLDCPSWTEAANRLDLVRDEKGIPALTSWWQSSLGRASYVDFTNPNAVSWWTSRLDSLRSDVGIDSFKFDAGEVNWLPSSYQLNDSPEMWPGIFTTNYASAVSDSFGGQIEVRVGHRSQRLPAFVRMLDKDSNWDFDNGLATIIPSLMQIAMAGYPFVLPDMIGGNGYGGATPSKELFIRWLQANVFMPSMQFSYVPWDYDQETIDYAVELSALRTSYGPTIASLAANAAATGEPINRPVWWIDPEDEFALAVEDEYLLGDDLLVAPVLSEGATSRDIYLPGASTVWRDANTGSIYVGGETITGYPADLFTLPYFIRDN